MRGTPKKISLPRRVIFDLMHASIRVPFVSLSRPLHIRPLLEARAGAAAPAGWAAIFVKAFALIAKDEPVLRTLYAKWPWPTFYELPERGPGGHRPGRGRRGMRAAAADCRPRRAYAGRNRRPDPACQGGAASGRSNVPQDHAGGPSAAAVAAAVLADRAQFRPAAGQLFRQFLGDLGRGLRWRRAPCDQSRAVHPELRDGPGRPDHRCDDPLGPPDYRRRPDRPGPDPAGAGPEH